MAEALLQADAIGVPLLALLVLLLMVGLGVLLALRGPALTSPQGSTGIHPPSLVARIVKGLGDDDE